AVAEISARIGDAIAVETRRVIAVLKVNSLPWIVPRQAVQRPLDFHLFVRGHLSPVDAEVTARRNVGVGLDRALRSGEWPFGDDQLHDACRDRLRADEFLRRYAN